MQPTLVTTTTMTITADRARSHRPGTVGWAFLVAAALAPLVTALIWYSIFGAAWLRLSGVDPKTALHPSIWPMLGQLGRNAVVVATLTTLARRLRAQSIRDLMALAALVWVGFEAMSVLGSVLHEGYPVQLYLIHIGDALQTTLVMATLIGMAQRRRSRGTSTHAANTHEGTAGR